MVKKSIVIIGAGIGGLAAGVTARQRGMDAHIFEMHSLPGGMCTAWTRQGYTFDGSIHHLAGCHPESPLYRMWEDLGAMPRKVLFPEDLTQVESPDGKVLRVYTDLNCLEDHMMSLFPEDQRRIAPYLRALRAMQRHDLLALSATGLTGLFSVLPALPRIARWGRVTMKQFAEGFRDPFLRRAFPTIQYDWPDIPVLLHLNLLSQCSARNYGFPEGGSLAFAQSIAQRFTDLGGTIHYGTAVAEILTKGRRATGLRLADGEEIPADAVVSNAFAHTTLFELLGEAWVDPKTRAKHAVPVDTMTMGIHVSLGVDRDLSEEPHALVWLLDRPVQLADQTMERIPIELYGFDSTLAPAGKGVIKVLLNTSYAYWVDLATDASRYREAKERLVEELVETLEPRFPGLRSQVEVSDVATPLTTERFTGNGLTYTSETGKIETMSMMFSVPKQLPKLDGFYYIGQSAGGGGIPGCASMGRNAINKLAKKL